MEDVSELIQRQVMDSLLNSSAHLGAVFCIISGALLNLILAALGLCQNCIVLRSTVRT